MSTSGEEIKVLLTADFAGLQSGMATATDTVTTSSEAMAAAAEESAAAINAAHTSIATIAEDSAARIKAMVAASLEQAAVDSGLAESERSLAERMGLRVEATDAQLDATAAAIAAQNEQMATAGRMAAAETEVAAATEAATVATTANTEAMVINGGVARELGVLTGEALRGNWTRLEGSSVTLANRMNLLQYAFSPLGLAIIGSIAGVYELASGYMEAADRSNQFNAALLTNGYAAGLSSSQLQQAADSLAVYSGDAEGADKIMQHLASSGRLTGQALIDAGTGASNIMRLTGASAEQAAAEVEKLGQNPAKSVVELNDKFHFLTVEIYDQIVALQKTGDAYGATELAAKAFADHTSDSVDKLNEQMGFFEQMFSHMREGAKELDKDLQRAIDPTLAQRSAQSTHEWFVAQTQLNEAIKAGASSEEIARLRTREEAYRRMAISLRDQTRAEDESQAAQGKKGAQDARVIAEVQQQEQLNAHLKDTSILQDQIALAKQRAEDIHKADPNSSSIKGINFDASGAVAGGEQWDAITKKLTKEYGEHLTPAIKKSGDTAREAEREASNALAMQRMGTQENTAARIQADATILASTRANSNEQRAALAQLLGDEKAYDAAVVKSREQALKKIEQDTLKNNEAIKKAYDQAYSTTAQAWHRYLDPINNAFQTSINGMIQGTQTLRQGIANILQSILASYVQQGLASLTNHIINEQAKTAATAAGAAERATIEAGAAAKSKAADAATGKSQITSAAATGAAKAYQAIVGIPYVGPILAPIAADVAFAGIEAFAGSIASARGGWERVPFDGAMTVLHQDEMVLPAHVANPIRQMAAGGGQGGGGMTVHLSSTDPRGFKDYLRRNPSALSDALKHAQRRGHFAGAMR
ncbi:MAG: phage tail length tape measure family protein [Elusimicrobia bacterium]|nr:phage tail length tape measure family protein [Elusimicrobiota bacterium]